MQFFPCVVLPLVFLIFPPKFTGTGYWFAAAGFYLLAKLLEHFDAAIFSALHVISGHSLKHLLAAVAPLFLYFMLRRRREIQIATLARSNT